MAPAAATPRWDAPPMCPAQAVVEQWIDRLMLQGAQDVPRWQGYVERSEDGEFVLTVTVSEQSRTIVDADCETLAVAAALVVAVAADPVAVVDALEDHRLRPDLAPPVVPTPEIPPPVQPAPTPVAGTPSSSAIGTAARRRADELQGVVSGAVGAELAVLPQPGFAASVGGGILWSWLRVEALGLVSVPRNVEARTPALGARAAVAGGQVRGCWVVPAKPVEVPLCLAGEIGAVWASGYGPNIQAQAKVQPWAAVVPSLGVTGWLSKHVGLEARVSVPVGLYKPAVHLAGVETHVFRAGAAGARLWVGPVVRFP